MSELVIRTDRTAFSSGYGWHIYSAEINISCNRPYSSRHKAKEAALEFLNKCLMDYEVWPSDYK